MGNRHKFGKGRVLGCECTYHFTCRACLDYSATQQGLKPLQGQQATDNNDDGGK